MAPKTWNPNTASWLTASRKARGWLQDDVVEKLAAASGIRVGRSWLSRIENGAEFSEDLYDAFVALYGSEPPAYTAPAAPVPGDLAAVMAEQNRLLAELVTANTRQADALDALLGLLSPESGRQDLIGAARRFVEDTGHTQPPAPADRERSLER